MDYKELYKQKDEEMSALIARWKVDSDLLYLSKYTMMSPDGKHTVPDVINITLSIPGRFANDVISTLGTAKEISIIETEDKDLDTTYIEDFRKAAFGAVNARLRLQGEFELNPWWDFHSCIRGGSAARCLFRMGKDKKGKPILIPDITKWDKRYVRYAVGEEGLEWAGYKTTRQKDAIEAQYHEELEKYHVHITGKGAEILDVWHTEGQELWVQGDKILEQEHKFGFTPVVIQTVTLGSMLADTDSLGHQGESIFFLIREAIPELERLVSIMQTLNFITLKPPKGWASKEGQSSKDVPEYAEVMGSASITGQDIGGGVVDINFGDAQRSAQLAYAIMEKAIREATVAASDLGVIESPPASGVRALVAGESRDQLLSPRLGNKSSMNQGLADMFTAQVIQIGGSIELGTPGHKRTFQASKLDGQYEGFYKYIIKSAAVDAGRASLAAAYGDDLSWRTKAETIYQLEDVDGEARQRNIEMAERLSPAIKMRRILESLVEDERNEEAELLSAEMGINLQQMMTGEMAPPKPEKEQEPKQVLSLFGGGGGRVKKPTEEE